MIFYELFTVEQHVILFYKKCVPGEATLFDLITLEIEKSSVWIKALHSVT